MSSLHFLSDTANKCTDLRMSPESFILNIYNDVRGKSTLPPDLISGGSVMFIQILSAIHNAGTLLFGIYCSAFFLGVKSNRKNILSLFLLFRVPCTSLIQHCSGRHLPCNPIL